MHGRILLLLRKEVGLILQKATMTVKLPESETTQGTIQEGYLANNARQ